MEHPAPTIDFICPNCWTIYREAVTDMTKPVIDYRPEHMTDLKCARCKDWGKPKKPVIGHREWQDAADEELLK